MRSLLAPARRSFLARGIAVVLPSAVLLATPAASADVLWRGDFETGDLSQWSKAQSVSPDRLKVVTDPVRQGKYALRVEVRKGDDPIGASGNRNELVYSKVQEKEGNDRWYAWSTRWDPTFPSEKTWQLFVQWHHTGSTGSPPLELYVYGEEMRLRIDASLDVWKAPLVRGKWHDFVLHVKWSSDPKVGFVELWYDGEKALEKTNGRTLFAGQENYLKMGLYRNDTIEPVGILLHDGMTIATEASDVMAGDGDAGVADAASGDAASDDAASGDAASDDAASGDAATADAATDAGASVDGAADSADLEDPGTESGGSCALSRRAGPRAWPAAVIAGFALGVALGRRRTRR